MYNSYRKHAISIEYIIVAVCLSISLFIYLFYRHTNTIINKIYIACFSVDSYHSLKHIIHQYCPINNNIIIFSFPEGLWVLSTVLLSYNIKLRFFRTQFSAAFLVLAFVVGLEIIQLLHLTNGQFDIMDLIVSMCFWLIGMSIINLKNDIPIKTHHYSIKIMLLVSCYVIVYLSDT